MSFDHHVVTLVNLLDFDDDNGEEDDDAVNNDEEDDDADDNDEREDDLKQTPFILQWSIRFLGGSCDPQRARTITFRR